MTRFPLDRYSSRPPSPTLAFSGVGREQVLAFVKIFYAFARADYMLGPVFNRIVAEDHWESHFETMTDFWSAVAFGGPSFRGEPMQKHARIPDLSAEHFARWLSIFEKVAREHWPEAIADTLIIRAQQIALALLTAAERFPRRSEYPNH